MRQTSINILKYILKQLARLTLWRFKPEIIAITGSVGKTSSKEAIFAVLSTKGKLVRKANENFNNELGVPLAILGNWQKIRRPLLWFWIKVVGSSFFRIIFLPRRWYPEILILEYGAAKPGDIKYLLSIAKPKIAVITAIGEIPVHVEFYEDVQAVAREKARLIEDLSVSDFAILNFDDKAITAIAEKTRAKTTSFGLNEGAEIKIDNFENRSEAGAPLGIAFKLEHKGSFVPIILKGIFGRPHAYAASVGVAVGLIYGLNLVEACELFSNNYKAVKGRMNLISGIKNSYIIDDSYNASPLSMREALKVLKELEAPGRKIAVLGDMLELGKRTIEAHESIGKLAAESADILITVGLRGKFIAEAAENAGLPKNHVLSYDTYEEAAKEIQEIIKKGDLVLVKGSRAVELDKAVALIV